MKQFGELLNEELLRLEEDQKKKSKKSVKKNVFKMEDPKDKSPVLKTAEERKTLKAQAEHTKIDKDFLASKMPEKPYKVTSKK